MNKIITSKLNESFELLGGARGRLQDEVVERKEEILSKGKTVAKRLDQQRDFALGSFRDSSRQGLFQAGQALLLRAAGLMERANNITPQKVSLVERGIDQLKQGADVLSVAEGGIAQPAIEGYDELNVHKIVEALRHLSPYEVQKTGTYEAANKNRVTVLREVRRQLA
jgi:hypothetical protein